MEDDYDFLLVKGNSQELVSNDEPRQIIIACLNAQAFGEVTEFGLRLARHQKSSEVLRRIFDLLLVRNLLQLNRYEPRSEFPTGPDGHRTRNNYRGILKAIS